MAQHTKFVTPSVIATLLTGTFSSANLLYNYPDEQVQPYLDWLRRTVDIPVVASYRSLSSPVHYGDIYRECDVVLGEIAREHPNDGMNILLSPGTPAMQSIWILLGKTKYPAKFYQSSREAGIQKVDIPFDIAAEFLPVLAARHAADLGNLAAGVVPVNAAFDDIITNNPRMMELKAHATVIATRDVPVLITGETGTGKELFATAIHNASERSSGPFVAVNCGAMPAELIDSALFGHVKGAFTGAVASKNGYFQQAHGGTLFLDEFGELPLSAQVRLLRVLQSGEIVRVGADKPSRVEVRVVAATNRDLLVEIAEGRFREDLFYRVAVGVLHLPPLRERSGDLALLADALLEQINREASGQGEYQRKELSPKAKNVILGHPWRGNVRELYSSLVRATLWAQGGRIDGPEIDAALFKAPSGRVDVLDRPLGEDFDIQDVVGDVVSHYVPRALAKTCGNRTKAAELLGLSTYQTLNNWIKKYGIKI